ncbi:MAG TPA: Ni/Fe hydrogenase subunit alpha [Candidatus Limnocylindrales bacterium]|nr:Ni/Fe hydrogenase subunit alpha [Candidatus Limnocylindrales bacterium]
MHGTDGILAPGAADERLFSVAELTRVEGEGSLHLRVRDGQVVEARLRIFEAPRYFERLVVGRTPDEVLDIVARICGICPIAYQLTAVHAFESLFGVQIDPSIRALRRLLYCGEWIESHALHVYLLHAPDFLGLPSAIELARLDRAVVERGLRLKKIGNEILTIVGGRAIHPVSLKVGGLWRAPRRDELAGLRADLDEALDLAQQTVRLVTTFETPTFEARRLLVSLKHPTEYPMNDGRIVSTDGLDLAQADWQQAFREEQVEGTSALHARTHAGEAYLLGPSARIALAGDQLHPLARQALDASGQEAELATNVFRSILARAVELVHATAEARDILDRYEPPAQPAAAWEPRAGVAAWATEAPRGLLFHRYDVDAKGIVRGAQIVPPTSQNQAAIEADLARFAPSVLALPHEEATRRFEQLIRSYDPCISCAAHFLDLRCEEVG